MTFQGLTEPVAVEDEYGNTVVRFADGRQIECATMFAAEASGRGVAAVAVLATPTSRGIS